MTVGACSHWAEAVCRLRLLSPAVVLEEGVRRLLAMYPIPRESATA